MAMSKTTSAPAKANISLAPSTFATGGGLLDDADVEIMDAAFLLWDYNGSQPQGPALGVTMRVLEGGKHKVAEDKVKFESGFEDHDQYYTAGKIEFFVPNEDGTGLVPAGDKTAITQSCNTAVFLASLVNVGLPESVLASGNIKDLIGTRLHVNRIEQEARKQGKNSTFTGDVNKKHEILVATKLISLPGEAPKAATGLSKAGPSKVTSAKPAASSTPATTASNGVPAGFDPTDPLHEKAQAWLLEVLMESGDEGIARKEVGAKIFAKAKVALEGKPDPDGPKAMKLAFGEEFLTAGAEAGAGWAFDGSRVTIAA